MVDGVLCSAVLSRIASGLGYLPPKLMPARRFGFFEPQAELNGGLRASPITPPIKIRFSEQVSASSRAYPGESSGLFALKKPGRQSSKLLPGCFPMHRC